MPKCVARLTVNVKLCVAALPTPLPAVSVNGKVPPVPEAGVPLIMAVPSWLSVKLTPVGRLDKASEGLLLLTNDSEWAARVLDPAEHVAVRLAAKEAVYKALQGSEEARGIGWREIEVVREQDGRPQVTLHGLAARRAKELDAAQVMLSLSHTHQAAVAVAIVVGPAGK